MVNAKAKILVVDDTPQNVRLLEKSLTAEGYQVIPAYSGHSALEEVSKAQPDLILLDVMMPVMDGYEVCKRLRENKKTRAIPIIMITAQEGGVNEKIEALNVGADEFIRKPFDRYELLARVRSLLRVKQLHDELVSVNQRLEEEMILAREVQQALLPQSYPDIPALEFAHKYIPTLAIGGDFFDIHELSPSTVGVFVCDVMGHGPQAAMITGIVKTLLTQLGPHSTSPGDLLSQMNERFHNLMASGGLPIFITAFSMMIDTLNGAVTYANAGHPTPFLIQRYRSRIEELTNAPGPAIGMLSNVSYTNSMQTLESGDMLFFFTDGLQELTNEEHIQFGVRELHKAIENNMHLSPRSFVEAIICAAEAFSNGIYAEDDITLLAVDYHYMGVDE